jgi:hypothetical protein
MRAIGWAYFWPAQIVQLVAAILCALTLLPIACRLKAWEPGGTSTKDGRPIDRWRWPVNWLIGNWEDGVSGQTAIVNGVIYNPSGSSWGAYCWNIRNSVNALSFSLALGWKNGPYHKGTIWQGGWKDYYGHMRLVLGLVR